jgi:hypothetical protein
VVFFLFYLFRLIVGFEAGAIAAVVLSVENEAAFKACACDSRYEEKRNETFEAAHED